MKALTEWVGIWPVSCRLIQAISDPDFSRTIGLSRNRLHNLQHNAAKLGRVKHSGVRWSQQESRSFLSLANNLYPSCDTQTMVFTRLERYFPNRSAISIKTRLRVLNWQAQQDE
ncbi:hypothetical protein T265_01939 [Opisthorchis viverrini]|uniref:Uncharacterized protein n=1 Tax=Opisthorchis viverrini TaxID=6198 RepID=A0A074ZWL1_OPIVI|nr:hypothetical protein T265_01939 [Opisthorchis viverrini]KER31848.1 hypothetical protein T265_01939 [Opisthorchis viverrini]